MTRVPLAEIEELRNFINNQEGKKVRKLNRCETCKYFETVYIRNSNNRYIKYGDGKGLCTCSRNTGIKGKDWEVCVYYAPRPEPLTAEDLQLLTYLLTKCRDTVATN